MNTQKVSERITYRTMQLDLFAPIDERLEIVLETGDRFDIRIQGDRINVLFYTERTGNSLIICPEASNVVQLIAGRIAQAR